MATTADWRKSAGKVVKVLILFWLGSKITPDQLMGVLPDDVAKLTVGALLVGVLNYGKHKLGWDWLKKIA